VQVGYKKGVMSANGLHRGYKRQYPIVCEWFIIVEIVTSPRFEL